MTVVSPTPSAEPDPRPARGGAAGRLVLPGLAIAALVVVLDQATKWWLLQTMEPTGGRPIRVLEIFDIVLVMNRGVSFGLFSSAGSSLNAVLFSLVAAVIVSALLVWLWRAANGLVALAIGLVIGGAIGNVIDRLRYGAVVDFLDFHWGAWHFPAFNAADSAICIGVGLMLIDGLLGRPKTGK